MSQIAILGASSPLGGHLVAEAIDAGWLVHGLARDPSLVRKANERLTLYQGDAEKDDGLEPIVTGCRYIIYAPETAHPASGVGHLLRAVGWKMVERIVFISRAPSPPAPVRKAAGVLAALLPKVGRGLVGDLETAEELLRLSGLPYCVFRVVDLTDEAPGQELVAALPNEPQPGPVGRVDLARFVVRSLSDRGWNLKEVTVGPRRRQP